MLAEQQWDEEQDSYNLFQAVHQKVSDRKKRLYGCACFKGVSLNELQNEVLTIAERYAEGIATEHQLQIAWSSLSRNNNNQITYALQILTLPHIRIKNLNHIIAYCHATEHLYFSQEKYNAARRSQANIFKSIFNPFIKRRDYKYNNNCIDLAKTLYAGNVSAHGPLHDALLDCGYELLARELGKYDFFKGNFVVDLILGKV